MSDIRSRVGYRGLVLFWLGWIFLFIGLALIPAQPPPVPNLWHTQLHLPWRCVLWILPAVVSLAAGARNYWTPTLQPVAFALLIIPPLTRAESYFGASVIEATIHGIWAGIVWQRLAAALVYVAIVIGVLLFSSWPEPARPRGLSKKVTV